MHNTKICTNSCFLRESTIGHTDFADDANSVRDDYRNEMNILEIYKKKLLVRKQKKERFLTQLLSYSITQFYFDRMHPELDYKL